MKRVLKIFVLLSVIGVAALAAFVFGGDILPAQAAETYYLYIVNNPSETSPYQYSEDGETYYDITDTLSTFIDNYYANYTPTDPLYLQIGEQGNPIVTTDTLTISKTTIAIIYLDNQFASTLPLDTFNREVVLATNSAIILDGDADMEIINGLITTDGSRAITQFSMGILTVSGDDTFIHSSCLAEPTFGGTIYIMHTESDTPAYIQNSGTVVNSSDSAYTSAILNYSPRDINILGGFVGSTPSDTPFGDNNTLGYGETNAIRNIFDGVVTINAPAVVASANSAVYYMGVINLVGASNGKQTLKIDGATIINRNRNEAYSKRCYTIYSINNNSIRIIDNANVLNWCGYAIYKSGESEINIVNSLIQSYNADVPTIFTESGIIYIADYSYIYGEAPNNAAVFVKTADVLVFNSFIESQNSSKGCLYVDGGDIVVQESRFINGSAVKVYSVANQNIISFDNFIITGNQNENIRMTSQTDTIDSDLNDFYIEAIDIDSSDLYFRAWYIDDAPYSDSAAINAEDLPSGSTLTIRVENVFAFIPDPDMQNGYLADHNPIKNFEGLPVELEFRPANAYYLYNVHYFDDQEQRVDVYTHSGTNYIYTPNVRTRMVADNKIIYADFRPVPIIVTLNDIAKTYSDSNIRFYASANAYSGITYFYSWYRDGAQIEGATQNYLTLYDVADSGNYSVEVTSELEGANTATAAATATIQPKGVTTTWSAQREFAYSGTEQYPTASALDLQGNPLSIVYSGISHLVGRHTVSVYTLNLNYILTNSSVQYDITPLSTTITWRDIVFTYNGSTRCPSAYAEDVAGNPLEITVSGGQSDAGSYTATATVDDGSYVFANGTQEYVISPMQANVRWSFDYTDINYNVFFYNGYDQLMGIHAYYETIYGYRVDLAVAVEGETTGSNVFKDPDTYAVSADFITQTNNYALVSANTQTQMEKAKPRISVPDNDIIFVYTGQPHSVAASVIYADEIIYLQNGSIVPNAFTQPGVYELVLTTQADDKHDAASQVKVSVTILSTTLELKDEEGNVIATLYNAQGVDPDAELKIVLNNAITSDANHKYTDMWGRTVLSLISISAVGEKDTPAEILGSSKVRLKLDDSTLGNKVLILRCLRSDKIREISYTIDDDGYIEFEADAMGEYAIVGASEVNSIIGISVFVVLTIVIVSALVVYLVRRKKSVF